jgi:hypothetical protein
MALILAILSLLTALVPIADRSIQQYQQLKQTPPAAIVQTVMKPLVPPVPPEAGQPNVVFRDGAWWKYQNGQWLVWRQNNQLAQGGVSNVAR